MKRVTNACVGGRNFTLNTCSLCARRSMNWQSWKLCWATSVRASGETSRVVTLEMVEKVVSTLGMPDGSPETGYAYSQAFAEDKAPRKLYRDMDNKGVAGVCSGLAWYFNIDVTIIRIIMLVALIAGTSGFWIYLVLWIAVPKAVTPAQQCEMRGIPATAENMARCKNHAQDTENR